MHGVRCETVEVGGGDEDDELVPIPDISDPCMKRWVTILSECRRLYGHVTARYMGSRSHESLYEVTFTDGSEGHLTREEVAIHRLTRVPH